MSSLSPRLRHVVDALPLTPEMRILEIGGGTGAAARAIAERLTTGTILMIDRSAKAIDLAQRGSADLIRSGVLQLRRSTVEGFVLDDDEEPFDLAFAARVGALDGRHPKAGTLALQRLAVALKPQGRLFIDGGHPLRELQVPR